MELVACHKGIWHYSKKFGLCQMIDCSTKIKCSNSSSLYRHMRSVHSIDVLHSTNIAALKPAAVANIVPNYFERKETFEKYMSRLVSNTKIPYGRHTTPELHEI